MKLLDQYLFAIGQNLPYKNREDIKNELRSLILDQLEAQYGENPTKSELESVITSFGTPKEVARRYTQEQHVIAPGLSDLYFMIMKIIGLALFIAFTVVFIVTLFSEQPKGIDIFFNFLAIPANTLQAFLGSVGTLTLIFIVITKNAHMTSVNLEEDWTVKELEKIPVGPEITSSLEAILSIFFTTAFIVLLVTYPEIITIAEKSFVVGIPLGHTINIDRFNFYLVFLAIQAFIEVIYHLLLLKTHIKTVPLQLLSLFNTGFTALLFAFMISDARLYLNDTGYIGFRIIFFIILAISAVEFITALAKILYNQVKK